MRLVDADKAENNLYGFTRYTGIDEAPYEHAEAVISKLPTIEAIPVEWIEEWLENIKNDKRYKSEYVELTKDVKQVEYKGTALIRIPCISDMLEDWEKENE